MDNVICKELGLFPVSTGLCTEPGYAVLQLGSCDFCFGQRQIIMSVYIFVAGV